MKTKMRSSWIVAGVYLLFSTCWIIFSDIVAEYYISGFESYVHAQTIKGLFFIVMSTAIILILSLSLNRKKDDAEGQLRKAKSAFRLLFKKAPVGYSIVDQQGKILESNYCFRKILKIKADKGEYEITNFFNHDSNDPVLKWMNSPREKGRSESQMLQRKLITAQGEIIWAQINISHINEEGRYLVSIQDMSSQKETQNKLFELKSELREIGKTGHIGHWELDIETGEIKLSEEIEFMLKPAAGKTKSNREEFISLLSEKEATHVRNAMTEAKENKTPLDVTFEYQSPEHEFHYFRLQGNWKVSKKIQQHVLAGTIRDITNDILLLKKKTEYARHLDIWTSAVSHELRRPITTMGGLLNLLYRKEISDNETSHIISHMKQSYDEMDKITQKFGFELLTQKNSLDN